MVTHYILAIATLSISTSLATTYLGSASSGKSTYYGGNPSGNACGYDGVETSSFPFGYYAACGSDAFDSGYGCGACYEITCIGPYSENPSCYCDESTPSVIISCMDQCPECDTTHFDLDPTSMARIVGDGLSGTCGVIETTVRRVACDYERNIEIRAKSGTSAYWYGLHVDYIGGRGRLSSSGGVKLKSSGSSSYETTCSKAEGPSFWICSGGFPLTTPVTVKLTDDSGASIESVGLITDLSGGASFDFGKNFDSSGSSSGTTSTTTTTTTTTTKSSGNEGGSVCGSTNLIFRNHDNSQQWWLATYITNACETCGAITKVEAQDTSGSWITGTNEWGYYAFGNAGNAFTGVVRISNAAGQEKTFELSSVAGGVSTTVSNGNLCCDSCFTETDESNNNGGNAVAIITGVAIGVIAIIVIIIIGFILYKRRSQKAVTFDHEDGIRGSKVETQEAEEDEDVEHQYTTR